MLNDYKGLKLIASSNPHIRNNEDTRSIMLDVIIALCPALIMSVIRFGFRALISVLVSVVSAMFFEWLYRKLMHKTQTLGDLSAAVTGVLLHAEAGRQAANIHGTHGVLARETADMLGIVMQR